MNKLCSKIKYVEANTKNKNEKRDVTVNKKLWEHRGSSDYNSLNFDNLWI